MVDLTAQRARYEFFSARALRWCDITTYQALIEAQGHHHLPISAFLMVALVNEVTQRVLAEVNDGFRETNATLTFSASVFNVPRIYNTVADNALSGLGTRNLVNDAYGVAVRFMAGLLLTEMQTASNTHRRSPVTADIAHIVRVLKT